MFNGNCRKTYFSGSFYPSEKFQLEKTIKKYIDEALVPQDILKSDVIAIVSPHAGYKYSGPVAAYSYKSVMGKNFDVAIILAPSHHFYLNLFVVDNREFYKTPFGLIKVNKDIVNFLRTKSRFEVIHEVIDEEHSLEVQLPFLYYAFNGNIEIVPVIYGEESKDFMIEMFYFLDEVLSTFSDKKILIVVSTDLSHYHTYDEAYEIDNRLVGILESRDFDRYVEEIYNRKIEACGSGPLGTFIYFSKVKNRDVRVLKLLNSGDTSGIKDYVVGYISAIMI
ncbi:MAG: AmmeMemoRadiSam system protein B [Brevinematia bacterium]